MPDTICHWMPAARSGTWSEVTRWAALQLLHSYQLSKEGGTPLASLRLASKTWDVDWNQDLGLPP
jgi:hypothetical protein